MSKIDEQAAIEYRFWEATHVFTVEGSLKYYISRYPRNLQRYLFESIFERVCELWLNSIQEARPCLVRN